MGSPKRRQRGSEGREAGKGAARGSAATPEGASEAGGALPVLCHGTGAVQLTADGPYFPKSTPESPLKAPALPVWGLDETCAALDVLWDRNELAENRETATTEEKNLEIWQKKNSVHETHKNVSIFAQRLRSLKVITSDRERLPLLWKVLKQLLRARRGFLSSPSRHGHS